MECPPRIIAIATALLARTPAIITRNDDECREFIKQVAEQVRYELGPAFGLKAAAPGHPQGPSQIAYTGEAMFGGWRIIELGGTQDAHILTDPPWQDFRDQVFIAVAPVPHLNAAKVPEPGPTPAPSPDLAALVAHLEARIEFLEAELRPLTVAWPGVIDDLHRMDHRRYVSKMWFGTIISVPE